MRRVMAALVLAAMAAASCGGDGDSGMTSSERSKVYGVVNNACLKAQTDVFAGLQQQGKADAAAGQMFTYECTPTQCTFSGEVAGPDGGKAVISGSGSYSENSFAFVINFDFQAYSDGGVTLDGSVHFELSGTQQSFTASMSGIVEATGTVNGTAEFDLTMTAAPGSVTVSGTINGHSFSYGGTVPA